MDNVITYSLEDNFIQRLADFICMHWMNDAGDLSRTAVVFGGKRPALFLKRQLALQITRSFFPPVFFSTDEFIEYILSRTDTYGKITDLNACFALYKLARDIAPGIIQGRAEFSLFLPWAREIFSFIEQLDLEDIPAEALGGVQMSAQIGYEIPQNINVLLEHIIALREAYHRQMKVQKAYSRGLLYRAAAGEVSKVDFAEFDRILFCNPFYLHTTEEKIIGDLYRRGKAWLFFQGSPDEWDVLRTVEKNLSCTIRPQKRAEPGYDLQMYAGFDTHSQVGIVRELVKKIDDPAKTVIVLPDAQQVSALLPEITALVPAVNVSMGYPLKRSSLYSLFQAIFKAQMSQKDGRYYFTDYIRVLNHPLVKNLKIFSQPAVTRVLVHKVEEVLEGTRETALSGSLFVDLEDLTALEDLYSFTFETLRNMEITVSRAELKGVLAELHTVFFTSWAGLNNFYEFSRALAAALDILLDKSSLGKYPLNLKLLEKMLDVADQMEAADFCRENFSPEEMFRVFNNIIDNEMISFSGSPLKGLQVLGLFETRSLNFDTVIIMDVNESVLPKVKIYEPLISREVMINLGLNRLEKEEEIQRYQFMRLISSAKKVHLVYSESADKEKSRFIEELIWEKQKREGRLEPPTVPKANFQLRFLPGKSEIEKTKDMAAFLRNLRYSASSINMYLNCPAQFYYKYVLGLEEKEGLQDELEAVDIGRFVHELLKETFAGFVGARPVIDAGFKKNFMRQLEDKFDDSLARRMKSDGFLIKEVLKVRMNAFLEYEQKAEERKVKEVLYLETAHSEQLQLSGDDFSFQYIVDRVERLDDESILIVDYKTGGTGGMPEKSDRLRSMELSREGIRDAVRSFQLPLYYYFEQKKFTACNLDAALYNLKNIKLQRLFGKCEPAEKEEYISLCIKALDLIVHEIIDPRKNFSAVQEERQCGFCPYFYACR